MISDTNIHRSELLSCKFDNISFNDVCDVVTRHVIERVPGYMMSLNLDILINSDKDQDFEATLRNADLVLMDSTPLMKLAKLYGIDVIEKLSGSDLMPKICEFAAEKGYSCFILGGLPGVPETASEKLKKRYKGLVISGVYSPKYGFEKSTEMVRETVEIVRNTNPDIMFLCLGEPKAGKLISKYKNEFDVPFTFNVGAAVDFAAENISRAPKWVQIAGFEWLYRFLQEPKRLFKRYFIDSWRIVPIIFKHGLR